MSAEASNPPLAKIDLHGYRPADFIGQPMAAIIQQAWEMGAGRLRFVHGHGRARGKSPGFYNTHTGYFGLRIRRELRHNRFLRQWIKYTTLEGAPGEGHPARRGAPSISPCCRRRAIQTNGASGDVGKICCHALSSPGNN